MKMFAVKDLKAEGFNTPFFQPTFGLAERSFKEATKDNQSFLSKTPEDFSLYFLGEFNQQTGLLTPEQNPKKICDAL